MPKQESAEMAEELETTQAAEMEAKQAEPEASADTDTAAELERTRKALADANKEAAKRRKQLEAHEAAEAERKAASMTELEKAQAALEELEKRATDAERGRKEALLKAAVIAKAGALRFNNAEDALAFLKPEALEIGDDGQVQGLEDALKAIAKERPYLLQQTGQVGATNPGRGNVEGETAAQKRARLWGHGNVDPLTVNGGVYWPNKT
jgi:chromosome segregation ATPase